MKKLILLIILLSVVLMPDQTIDRKTIFENHLWKQKYEEYSSDQEIVAILRSKKDKITSISVYFAFWCGDSENNVPPFIKILDEMKNSSIGVNYFIVKRKGSSGRKYYNEELKVEKIPTFIFFKDGKEIGRITENPKKTLEEDFLEIVF